MATIPETINFQTGNQPGLPGKVFRRLRNAFALLQRDNARVWLRRITVAAWMNVLIAAAAAVTATTAGAYLCPAAARSAVAAPREPAAAARYRARRRARPRADLELAA